MSTEPSDNLNFCACPICSQYLCTDWRTHTKIPGLYVPRHTYRSHQYRWAASHDDNAFAGQLDVDIHPIGGAAFATTLVSSQMDVDPVVTPTLGDIWEEEMEEEMEVEGVIEEILLGVGEARGMEVDDQNEDNFCGPGEMPQEVGAAYHQLERIKHAFQRITAQNPHSLPVTFDDQPSHSDYLAASSPPLLPFSKNRHFCVAQRSLDTMMEQLHLLPTHDNSWLEGHAKSLIKKVQKYQHTLQAIVDHAWNMHKCKLVGGPHVLNTISQRTSSVNRLHQMDPVLLGALLVTVILNTLCGLSQDASNFLLATLSVILSYATATASSCVQCKPTLPKDIREAIKLLDIDPAIIRYATCPQCCAIYPSDLQTGTYPETCSYQATPQSKKCATQLLHKGQPIRPFGYQPFTAWLERFLARSDIVMELKTASSTWGSSSNDDICHDILGSHTLRSFKGYANDRPFLEKLPEDSPEMHLVFALNIDWFNPYGNKAAKKSASVGGIYLVCLNLPVHLRYKVENIYLAGIIPGPHEPSLHQLNHFLCPLIDDLLELWSPGVVFSSIPEYDYGCIIRCAIIALIADLLAIRKIAGLRGVTANTNFCSFCRLSKKDIGNLDNSTWPRYTTEEHLKAAEMWLDAQTEQERQQLFQENGVYWTELLRLPYWEPLQFTLLDAMHNLFLNVLKLHCRTYWGMDSNTNAPRTNPILPHSVEDQEEHITRAGRAIEHHHPSVLGDVRKTYLVAFASKNNIMGISAATEMKKGELVQVLLQWHLDNPQTPLKYPSPHTSPTISLQPLPGGDPPLLDYTVLREVWSDMKKVIKPSWLGSVPHNLGTPSHGKLSADQWRTACTIYLVFTLIRLWGNSAENSDEKDYLDNYLHLITAVRWATMRTTSKAHVHIIDTYFHKYFEGVITLFGVEALRPNSHLTLHLAECISSFGPVHGWWAFPFERYNGIIQRQNTNSKLGELELTFLRAFCRGSNIKALMSHSSLPPIMQSIQPIFNEYMGRRFQGTLLEDLIALGATGLPEELPLFDSTKTQKLKDPEYTQLLTCVNHHDSHSFCHYQHPRLNQQSLQPYIQPLEQVTADGVTYTCWPLAEPDSGQSKAGVHGNSQILFSHNNGPPIPGRIRRIFTHQRPQRTTHQHVVNFFFQVSPLKALEAALQQKDPYRAYPLLDVGIYYDTHDSDVIIMLSNIIAHFASCPLEGNFLGVETSLLVVLSLDRNGRNPPVTEEE